VWAAGQIGLAVIGSREGATSIEITVKGPPQTNMSLKKLATVLRIKQTVGELLSLAEEAPEVAQKFHG
jgi:hypothetical protein